MDDRLAALEARLRRLEDEQEIARLIASYGPLVDSGSAEQVADIWTEDGVYDVEARYMANRGEIHDMVLSDDHQGLISKGCCHFLGPAHVTVEGDTARAICHSILLVRHKERFLPARVGANHWKLTRTADGWRVTQRVTRPLDGTAEAPQLLATGVLGEDAR